MANRNRIRQLCLKRNTEYAIPLQGKIRRYKLNVFDNPSITFRVSHTKGEVANGIGNAFNAASPYDSGYIELTNPTLYLSADNDGGVAILDYLSLQEVAVSGSVYSQTKYLASYATNTITGYASAVDWSLGGSGNFITSNPNFTGAYNTGDNRTRWAEFTNGGFSIPTGATITGVVCEYAYRFFTDTNTTLFWAEQSIKVIKGGTKVIGLHDGVDASLFGDPYTSEFPPSLYPTVQDVANLNQPCDDNAFWIDGYPIGGTGQSYWVNKFADPTYYERVKSIHESGHARLGGTTLTPAQVNASDFGFAVTMRVDNPQYPNFTTANNELRLGILGASSNGPNAPSMTVYYTL